jgi:hypothetical protein|tara:strand:- start:881 stop:1093 length:213 start_codon:yes stop_codon:yes gene_type:complete
MEKLKGANMDIDLEGSEKVEWEQDKCPWSEKDGESHKCAVKDVSLCKYFKGIEHPDKVLCVYDEKGEEVN